MEDQHDLSTPSNTLLGLMLQPMTVCLLVLDRRCWMLLMKCWMEGDQSCGASQANSVGTTIDASGKDRTVPGFKTFIQVVAAPIWVGLSLTRMAFDTYFGFNHPFFSVLSLAEKGRPAPNLYDGRKLVLFIPGSPQCRSDVEGFLGMAVCSRAPWEGMRASHVL